MREAQPTQRLAQQVWQNVLALGRKRDRPRSCFVAMPFDPKHDEHYALIKRTIETALPGVQVVRADRFEKTGTILRDILRRLTAAEFVIADLSGNNPNVLYEVGLAHGLLKRVLFVSDRLDNLPFDLSGFPVLTFPEQSPRDTWDAFADAVRRVSSEKGAAGPVHDEVPGMVVTIRRAGDPLFWQRPVAFALDVALLWIFIAIALGALGLDLFQVGEKGKQLSDAFGTALLALGWAYFTFLTWLSGQTIGKVLLGIRVESADGEPLSVLRAAGRPIAYILDFLTLGVGPALAAAGPAYRCIHDRTSGTIVVRA